MGAGAFFMEQSEQSDDLIVVRTYDASHIARDGGWRYDAAVRRVGSGRPTDRIGTQKAA
jgi:hypothetical protein